MQREPTQQQDETAKRILDAAFIVHRELGCGLLESVYEICLFDVLTSWNMKVEKLMTYLRLSNNRLGLLLNFNAPLMKQGIKRIVMSQIRGDLGARGVV